MINVKITYKTFTFCLTVEESLNTVGKPTGVFKGIFSIENGEDYCEYKAPNSFDFASPLNSENSRKEWVEEKVREFLENPYKMFSYYLEKWLRE
jgi:hypothetical protein